jgi:hypothetical protein
VAVAVRFFWEMMDDQVQVLVRLLDALRGCGVRHALAGGHAVSAYTRPRLTDDVDLIVDGRRRAAVEAALSASGWSLQTDRDVIHVRHGVEAPSVADLLLSDSHPTWAEALRGAEPGTYQGQSVQIVTRPALVAMKSIAATSLTRPQEERLIDVADIGRLVKAPSWTSADHAEAVRIAALAYPGAGAELARLVADLLANRPVTI